MPIPGSIVFSTQWHSFVTRLCTRVIFNYSVDLSASLVTFWASFILSGTVCFLHLARSGDVPIMKDPFIDWLKFFAQYTWLTWLTRMDTTCDVTRRKSLHLVLDSLIISM